MNSIRVASAISLMLNPLIVAAPTFLALLISEKVTDLSVLMLIALTFGTVVPIVILCGLVRRGTVSDLYVSNRESRPLAFVPVASSYLIGAIWLLLARAPPVVTSAMLCYLGNTLVIMLVSLRWKISVHTSGITGPVTALAHSLGVTALLLFGLVVPVGWARMRLGAHTLLQILAGALLTVATTWLQLRIYMTFL